jgi:hypothetical protein
MRRSLVVTLHTLERIVHSIPVTKVSVASQLELSLRPALPIENSTRQIEANQRRKLKQ